MPSFCLLNVITNGMYQYKHDALFFIFASIILSIVFVVVIAVVVVVSSQIGAFLEATELGGFLSFVHINSRNKG